jgi:hypothetical protein
MFSGSKAFFLRQGCCRLMALSLVILVLLIIVAIVDLKNAPVQEAELDNLTVDLTRSVPYFVLDVAFLYGSRLSRVVPKEVRCSFPEDVSIEDRSAAAITASFHSQGGHLFQVEVTCEEEAVKPLGRKLWELVSEYFDGDSEDLGAAGNRNLEDSIQCELEIDIEFLHVASFHRSVDLPRDELAKIEQYFEEQESTEDSLQSGFMKPMDDDTDDDTTTTEIHVGLQSFEAMYQLTMPAWVSDMLSRIQIISPSIEIAFQGPWHANETSQRYFFPDTMSLLTISPVNATFETKNNLPKDGIVPSTSGSDLVYVEAKCSDPFGCPWFGPWFDWYNLAVDGKIIDIVTVVSAEGSFLETWVGQVLSISYMPNGNDIVLGRQRQLTTTFQGHMEEAAKECLGLSDNSNTFNFAVCWLFRLNEGMILTGDLFFFEDVASGVFKSMWDTNSFGIFRGNTTALLQFGNDQLAVDARGSLFLDWTDLADIAIDVTGRNDGSWSSFQADMLGEGSQLDNALFMNFGEAKLILGDDILFEANGFMNLDWKNSIVLSSSLFDPSQGMNCSMGGSISGDVTKLLGKSRCLYEEELLWSADIDVSGDDKWSGVIEEAVSGFLAAVVIRWEENIESFSMVLEEVILHIKEGRENVINGEGSIVIKSDGTEGSSMIEWNDAGTLGYSAIILTSWISSDSSSFVEDFFLLNIDQVILAQDGVTQVNMVGIVSVDYYSSTFNVLLEDTTRLNYFNSTGNWTSDSSQNIFVLVLQRFSLAIDNEVVADIEGQMDLSANSAGYLYISLEDPSILEGVANLGSRWVLVGQSFTLYVDNFVLQVEQDLITDFEGRASYSTSGMSFVAVDRAELDFVASSNMLWQAYDGSGSDPGFFQITNSTFRWEDDIYVNSTISLQWSYHDDGSNVLRDYDEDPFVINIEFNSTDDADLKMGMKCGMEVGHNAETLSMTMDKLYIGWRDEVFVSGGVETLSATPRPAPMPLATLTPGTEPPTQSQPDPIVFPTAPPTQSMPVASPAPTPVGSIAPMEQTEQEQSKSFSGITLPLQGITKELSEESVRAFEYSLENYYKDYYPSALDSKRVLQSGSASVRSFHTAVEVTDQQLTEEGLNMVYDQNITYAGDFGVQEYVNPMDLILEPLLMQSQQNKFKTDYLQTTGQIEFENVTSVGIVKPPPSDDRSSGPSKQWSWGATIIVCLVLSFALAVLL